MEHMTAQLMIERTLLEYTANALWLVPLLAASAWGMVWATRPAARVQHLVWLTALFLAVMLPAYGTRANLDQDAAAPLTEATYAPRYNAAMNSVVTSSLSNAQAVSEVQAFTATPVRDEPTAAAHTWAPRVHRIRLAASATYWLVAVYILVVAYSVFGMARAWSTARRLVRHSSAAPLAEATEDALMQYSERLGIRAPEVRESDEIAGPVLIGARHPVLLMPRGFLLRREREIHAALLHELAHVQRRDYVVNLLCQLTAMPIAWHPATIAVQQRIARTREMACDAIAATEMDSHAGYAHCLLAMARGMVANPYANLLGLFGGGAIEERVTRLMETETMQMKTKIVRGLSAAAATASAIAVGMVFHVVPVLGQQTGVSHPPSEPIQSVAAETPQPQASSAATAAANPTPAKHQHAYAAVNGQVRSLTPEEQARADKDLARANADMQREIDRIQSPEFQRQIEESKRRALEVQMQTPQIQAEVNKAMAQVKRIQESISSGEIARQIEAAKRSVPTPEQRAEMQREIDKATAQINSPEFRRQLEQIQSKAFQDEIARIPKTIDTAAIARDVANSMAEMERSMQEMRVEPRVDIHMDPIPMPEPAPLPEPAPAPSTLPSPAPQPAPLPQPR